MKTHITRVTSLVVAAAVLAQPCMIVNAQPATQPAATGVTAGLVGTALQHTYERGDPFARSMIRPGVVNQIKGEVAEQMAVAYLDGAALRARVGRTGFDALHGVLDAGGRPRELIVYEAKYGLSQLGQTADGVQLGRRWSDRRLVAMANRLNALAEGTTRGSVSIAARPPGVSDVMPVPMTGRTAMYWRANPSSGWNLDPANLPPEAVSAQTREWSRLMRNSAAGSTPYRRVLVQIKPTENGLRFDFRDAARLSSTTLVDTLPITRSVTNEVDLNKLRSASSVELARVLRAKLPEMSVDDINAMAQTTARNLRSLDNLHQVPETFGRGLARRAAVAGALGASLDTALRFSFGERDAGRLAINAASTGTVVMLSNAVGEGVERAMLRSPSLYARANAIGLSTGLGGGRSVAGLAKHAFRGGGYLIVLPIVQYSLGLTSSRDATREVVSGAVGFGAGAVASGGTVALISAFGTASTGTAISSLGGAAATNATLAWLGGGSVAAGGGGVAAGSTLLLTGVGAVVVLASVTTMVAFNYYDEKQEQERIRLTIESLKKVENFPIEHVSSTITFRQQQSK
jgi:hypothetical protein